MTTGTPRETILAAFDQLFDTAIARLNVSCTPEERLQAREAFAQRMAPVFELVERSRLEVPAEAIEDMRRTIDRLTPADVAGLVASIPIAQHTQELLKTLAYERARQQLLLHLTQQAEPSPYGGH
ncbi:MAG TPA: hypothetical protein VNO26_03040 [Candidatus Limnocylindria bacterium]|nr:hypothetical protein [Candidatus Limnocylindria bacterium]